MDALACPSSYLPGVTERALRAPAFPVYCAHTVPTIFTAYSHGPRLKIAFAQVRGTLSSMTVDDLPAGIIPGLQTSPSALGL